jgi:hypothetical protein
MRLLVDEVLWRTLIHVSMGLELKEQVQYIDKEEDLEIYQLPGAMMVFLG